MEPPGVLAELIADRGWAATATPGDAADLPLEGQDLHGVYTTGPLDPHPLAVIVNFDNPRRSVKVAVKDVRLWCAWMADHGMRHVVFVSHDRLNNYILHELTTLEGITVNLLTAAELRVNPTRTVHYVPHTRLGAAEAAAVKRRYGALMVLPVTDPVARYYGWNVGDVVRVRRDYGGFEFTDVFREVRARAGE